MNGVKDKPNINWFRILSLIISLYLFIIFIKNVGIFPNCPLADCHWNFLLLSLFFAIMPFFSKIKIAKFFELERDVKKTKEELSKLKEDTQFQISMLSTNINTISSLQNTVNINIPGLSELQDVKSRIYEHSEDKIREEATVLKDELVIEGEDLLLPLVKTRMKLEELLRKILGKKIYFEARKGRPVKYMGLHRLFMTFIQENQDYHYLLEAYKKVNQVYNAAAHAQIVTEQQTNEALEIGASIMAILQDYLDRNK